MPASNVSRILRRCTTVTVLTLLGLPLAGTVSAQGVEDGPSVILSQVPFSITVSGGSDVDDRVEIRTATGRVLDAGTTSGSEPVTFDGLLLTGGNELPLTVQIGADSETLEATYLPGWFSIVPPLVAILLALIFKEVVTALFAGIWLGALAIAGFNPLAATARVIDQFAVPAITDSSQASIVFFSLLLGGMVGIISKNGGTFGVVEAVSPLARNPVRGKLATWAAGLAIFFDDYANTLIVGNTMRPITDRLKISREKLAYLVDSTAAPVAALVPISTWVGFEITLIASGLSTAAGQTTENPALSAALAGMNPFTVFIQTIPYLFYPLLALAFVFMTSLTNRDFGAMAEAERRSASGGGVLRPGSVPATDTSGDLEQPKEGAPHRWINAVVPVLTVIFVVLIGLYQTGAASVDTADPTLWDIFGAADPFVTLLWGSLAGCIVATLLTLAQRIMTVHECISAWLGGLRAMMIAIVILVLAWSLGSVTDVLGTANYLSQVLSDALPLQVIPALVFITAAAIAFATGTSWGTMTILLPIVIPLTINLGGGAAFDLDASMPILLSSIGSVLAGAIFGDHCSPISDTTVMSSMASGCDHIDHVRTQLPYALVVGIVAVVVGNLGTAFGLPAWIALLLSLGILYAVLRVRGVQVSGEVEAAA